MNLNLSDRWCDLAAVWRVACWATLLLLSLLAGLVAAPELPAAGEPDLKPQWARLQALRQQASVATPPAPVPFSALGVQTAGARLMRWQPGVKGGELALRSDWRSIPPLFALLARSEVAVVEFNIAPQGGALDVAIRLEMSDGD